MNPIDLFATFMVLSMVVLSATAIVSWLYVRWVVKQAKEPPRELRRILTRDGRIALGALIIGSMTAYSLIRFIDPRLLPPIPSPWGLIVASFGVDLLLWGVTDDALTFRRYRRERPPQE
jgi:hypothetical protein